MVTIGVDAHMRTHTFAAVDGVGRELANRTFAATHRRHLAALGWARAWPERTFARILGVTVADEEADILKAAVDHGVPGLLGGDPRRIRMSHNATQVHPAGGKLDHEQDVERLHPHGLDREEDGT